MPGVLSKDALRAEPLHADGVAVEAPHLWSNLVAISFNSQPPEDLDLDRQIHNFLKSEQVIGALTSELRIDRANVRALSLDPENSWWAGPFHACAPLAVRLENQRGESSTAHFALKIRNPAGRIPWENYRHFIGPHDELELSERIVEAGFKKDFTRTLAIEHVRDHSRQGAGTEVALDTFVSGEPLNRFLRRHPEAGCAAAASALTVMCRAWSAIQFTSRHDDTEMGLLYNSHVSDIVVGGTTARTAAPVFVAAHGGHLCGNHEALLRNASTLLSEMLLDTPPRAAHALGEWLSPTLIGTALCRPLREHGVAKPWEELNLRISERLREANSATLTTPWSHCVD